MLASLIWIKSSTKQILEYIFEASGLSSASVEASFEVIEDILLIKVAILMLIASCVAFSSIASLVIDLSFPGIR